LAAKRALFAERVAKPVFFDNAFNYIDLPMDELLVKAGREPAKVETATPVSVAESVVQKVEKAAEEVKKTVVGRERTRESTPAAESQQEEKPKGWLGGWFGRG
jgi:signal recognition particle subunit SRP68